MRKKVDVWIELRSVATQFPGGTGMLRTSKETTLLRNGYKSAERLNTVRGIGKAKDLTRVRFHSGQSESKNQRRCRRSGFVHTWSNLTLLSLRSPKPTLEKQQKSKNRQKKQTSRDPGNPKSLGHKKCDALEKNFGRRKNSRRNTRVKIAEFSRRSISLEFFTEWCSRASGSEKISRDALERRKIIKAL